MSMINYASREINCKIVYYGPGLGGKTSNLEYIYSRVNPDDRGKMISLATETERTLFFDFLPIDLGEVRGFKTRFHLYTVPGQVYYDVALARLRTEKTNANHNAVKLTKLDGSGTERRVAVRGPRSKPPS